MNIFRLHLLCVIFCGFSGIAEAQEVAPVCSRTFSVGTLSESPYFLYSKGPAKTLGLVKDFLDEFQKRSGCKFSGSPMNHVRAYDDIKNLRLDMFALLAPSEKWNKVADSLLIYSFQRVLFIRGASYVEGKTVQQYLDDPKVKFANLIGTESSFTPVELEKLLKQKRIVQSSSPDGVVKLVTSGQAQVAFLTPAYLRYLRKKGVSEKEVQAVFDEKVYSDVGLYVSKKRVSVRESAQIRGTIESMRSDGTIMQIMGKYVSPEDLKRYK